MSGCVAFMPWPWPWRAVALWRVKLPSGRCGRVPLPPSCLGPPTGRAAAVLASRLKPSSSRVRTGAEGSLMVFRRGGRRTVSALQQAHAVQRAGQGRSERLRLACSRGGKGCACCCGQLTNVVKLRAVHRLRPAPKQALRAVQATAVALLCCGPAGRVRCSPAAVGMRQGCGRGVNQPALPGQSQGGGTQALQLRPNGCGMQRACSCGRTARKWCGCHSLDLLRQRIWAPHWWQARPPSGAAGQRLDGCAYVHLCHLVAHQFARNSRSKFAHCNKLLPTAVHNRRPRQTWPRPSTLFQQSFCCLSLQANAVAVSAAPLVPQLPAAPSCAVQLEAAAHEPLSCGSDLAGKAGSLRPPEPSGCFP